jgi:hypothetical protein
MTAVDPVTGLCDDCTQVLTDNHFLKGRGFWRDGEGVRHVRADSVGIGGGAQTMCSRNIPKDKEP